MILIRPDPDPIDRICCYCSRISGPAHQRRGTVCRPPRTRAGRHTWSSPYSWVLSRTRGRRMTPSGRCVGCGPESGREPPETSVSSRGVRWLPPGSPLHTRRPSPAPARPDTALRNTLQRPARPASPDRRETPSAHRSSRPPPAAPHREPARRPIRRTHSPRDTAVTIRHTLHTHNIRGQRAAAVLTREFTGSPAHGPAPA